MIRQKGIELQTLGSPPIICGDDVVSSRTTGPNDLKRDIIYQVLESTVKLITSNFGMVCLKTTSAASYRNYSLED